MLKKKKFNIAALASAALVDPYELTFRLCNRNFTPSKTSPNNQFSQETQIYVSAKNKMPENTSGILHHFPLLRYGNIYLF